MGSYFQSLTLVVSSIRDTLLATHVFLLVVGEEIHDKTVFESVQKWALFICTFNTDKILSIRSVNSIWVEFLSSLV
jgi:hypothetical protein